MSPWFRVGERSVADWVGIYAAGVLDAARELGLTDVPRQGAPVSDADVRALPDAVQRYLRFMGVIGRPRDRCFRACFEGRFRRGEGAWMTCEAWQFDTRHPVARIFDMRLDFARVVPMVGRDAYVAGRGSMHGDLLGLITVAQGAGEEFDIGELVTFLNDALVLAPSMLLDDSVSWSHVDDHCFDVSLTDAGHTVAARILIDDYGAMRDFSTTDRFCDLPNGLTRTRWTTPMEAWQVLDGRPFPTRCAAIWHLPDGPLSYVDGAFVPGSVIYNEAALELSE